MNALTLLALTLSSALALRINAPKVDRCVVPMNFHRIINPKAHRVPTDEEKSRPGFYAAPHIEKIFYINLDKSIDRKASVEAEIQQGFPGVKFERFRATTKGEAKLLAKDFEKYTSWRNSKGTGFGQYSDNGIQATYHSHRALLEKISKMPDPNAVYIIVEDDVHFKKNEVMENVKCQIHMLPPEWDLFKFGYTGFLMKIDQSLKDKYGYPGCTAGERINEHTCHQEKFNWNWMGNQAYAVRPKGAAVLLEHLQKVPIMDVDGAMMPGVNYQKKGDPLPVWPNTYVSKHNLVGHYGFKPDRTTAFKAAVQEEALDEARVETTRKLIEKENVPDEDSRETSSQEMARLEKGQSDLFDLSEDHFA